MSSPEAATPLVWTVLLVELARIVHHTFFRWSKRLNFSNQFLGIDCIVRQLCSWVSVAGLVSYLGFSWARRPCASAQFVGTECTLSHQCREFFLARDEGGRWCILEAFEPKLYRCPMRTLFSKRLLCLHWYLTTCLFCCGALRRICKYDVYTCTYFHIEKFKHDIYQFKQLKVLRAHNSVLVYVT